MSMSRDWLYLCINVKCKCKIPVLFFSTFWEKICLCYIVWLPAHNIHTVRHLGLKKNARSIRKLATSEKPRLWKVTDITNIYTGIYNILKVSRIQAYIHIIINNIEVWPRCTWSVWDHIPSLAFKIKIAEGMKDLFQRFFSPKVLLDASVMEVHGKRHLVDVHHHDIFG